MDDDADNVFHALAHADRRRILDIVRAEPGMQMGALAAKFTLSRIAVHKHVQVLEAADLLVSERQGRTRKLYFNLVPIQKIYERWTDQYSAAWAAGLTRFARRAEKQAGKHGRARKSSL